MNYWTVKKAWDEKVEGECSLECSEGWYPIIHAALSTFRAKPEVLQVKEKFGELRIYLVPNKYAEFNHGVCTLAETLSRSTCEVCGQPGRRCGKNVYLTRCVNCYPDPV